MAPEQAPAFSQTIYAGESVAEAQAKAPVAFEAPAVPAALARNLRVEVRVSGASELKGEQRMILFGRNFAVTWSTPLHRGAQDGPWQAVGRVEEGALKVPAQEARQVELGGGISALEVRSRGQVAYYLNLGGTYFSVAGPPQIEAELRAMARSLVH